MDVIDIHEWVTRLAHEVRESRGTLYGGGKLEYSGKGVLEINWPTITVYVIDQSPYFEFRVHNFESGHVTKYISDSETIIIDGQAMIRAGTDEDKVVAKLKGLRVTPLPDEVFDNYIREAIVDIVANAKGIHNARHSTYRQ